MAEKIPARMAQSLAAGATSILALVPEVLAGVFAIAEAAVAVAGRFVTAVSFALDVAKDKAQRATEWLRDAFSE